MSMIIAGYIAAEPQLRYVKYVSGDKAVCDLRFSFTQKDKEVVSVRQINMTAWNSVAENAAKTYANGGYAIVNVNYHKDEVESAAGRTYLHSLSAIRIMPGMEGSDLNFVSLVGRVGADASVREFPSGATKATTRLAVSRDNDATDWVGLEAWGIEAQVLAMYVPKGRQIAVEGRLQIDQWKDKETGSDRMRPFVLVDRLTLLGKVTEPQYLTNVPRENYIDPYADMPY